MPDLPCGFCKNSILGFEDSLHVFLLNPILGEAFLPMLGQHIFQIELVDVETHQLLEKYTLSPNAAYSSPLSNSMIL